MFNLKSDRTLGSKVGEEARQGSYSRQPVAIGKVLSRAVFPEQQRYSHIEAYVVCFERRAQSKTCLSQVCFSVEQQRDHQNWPCRFWKCTQYDMIGSEDKKSSCQSCFIPSPTCQKRWFFSVTVYFLVLLVIGILGPESQERVCRR
jgi:hypothetical protein